MRTLLALALLCSASLAEAGPKKLAHSFGSQVKRTFYTDVKQHPISWGLNLALQWGIALSDTASSCYEQPEYETGPARYFIGHNANCRKLVTLSVSSMFLHSISENWLANSFKRSCDRDAANPDSRWWKVDSRTKSTAACYWAPPLVDTLALGAYEIPVIRSNTKL
jgi:hypothetical protein